jgi:hypothetical protein
VQAVAAIAAESLVAAIARQGHRHMLARQLADAVGGDRRAVGIGLVVQPGQRVDQIEVVAGDHFAVMVGAVAVGHRLGEGGFVERGSSKAIEQVLTGSFADSPAIIATTALESTPPERNAPSGTSEIMRRRIDSRELLVQLRAGFLSEHAAVETEAHVPVFRGSAPAGRDAASGVAWRQLSGLTEDGARLGHVAEREVFLDRQRIDVARQAAMRQQRLELGAEEQVPSGSSA